MAHTINETCANCGVCVSDCPVEAISEKDGIHWIDPNSCTDCGACVSSCPADAIVQS